MKFKQVMSPTFSRGQRVLAYILGLVLAFATALTSYISSSFLAERLGEGWVGLVYAAASIATLLLLAMGPWLLKQYQLQTIIFIGGLTTSIAALGLASNHTAGLVVGAFIIFYAGSILLRFLTDLYLEEATDNITTGKIRGFFLTLVNLGWLLSPLAAAALITNGGYRLLYITSGLLFMPVGLLIINHSSKRSNIKQERWWQTLRRLIKNKDLASQNLKNILFIDLWLNIFYAVMVVYSPIYLHEHIGLDWPSIGIIFTWMLLPFVLVEYPLGRLADRVYGEKELLIVGLIIAGVSTLVIPWLLVPNILAWSVLLFITRVGAAAVEIMKETYLFKKIGPEDVDVLTLSRNMVPLSYLIAPLFATLVLFVLPIHFLFALLGLSALLMIPVAQKIIDTK